MGLISRVSSRTYRKRKKTNNNGPKSYLQTPTLEKAKQEIRPKPGRPIRSNPKQQLATTKGIDSAFRRRFSGQACHPGIGYGTNKNTRHTCRDHFGFKKFLVHSGDELNCLMMSNRQWACEIAKGVSSKKRKTIVER